ncbi:hypothetical protein [Streptomyces sp. CB01881]|uniref:hypothetical protein n=1 Tax=Streptomyces sp. CB01881 TaxID=2078691 RepID=UPI0011DF9E8B|nr:hypothetical protein [Streptomyces sp. CB01881]TYC70450.1 hypothetical protein EH183_31820 [Streptomyces sp. CB01881]
MAKQLTAMSDLYAAFAKFPELSALVDLMGTRADAIDGFNRDSAGNDDIGKTYHKNADAPTQILHSLIKGVRNTLNSAGTSGQHAAALFDNANEDANSVV